ncbi:MAG: hypothetical protein HY664_04175 [Chloroflexi bacterium]|nr:hypothetical protein [Chloroflexota bacterium]
MKKRWILALVIVAVLTLGVLQFTVLSGGPALAAGPGAGTGPWIAGDDANCPSPDQYELINTNSGKAHCFRR